ncbi:MAG: biliverdin-producing heme oxygenase, partial [Hyphomicrobium sp.]|nr:biliverdin-producing heme oxygenase [Hyphomicrobium sp.]
GWLYVAEGSNLGAAFLLKEAEKLGLSDTSGARHLAGAPEGRGLHWRTFVAALDAVTLSAAEEQRAVAEAEAAFERVHALTEQLLPLRASEPV